MNEGGVEAKNQNQAFLTWFLPYAAPCPLLLFPSSLPLPDHEVPILPSTAGKLTQGVPLQQKGGVTHFLQCAQLMCGTQAVTGDSSQLFVDEARRNSQ